MVLKINNKNYEVKFGYNSFCDTDLMDRTEELLNLFQKNKVDGDNKIAGIGKMRELFECVRELLFVGFQKKNPVETLQEVGNLIDDWQDEASDDRKGIFELFTMLTEELLTKGFLGELTKKLAEKAKETEIEVQK